MPKAKGILFEVYSLFYQFSWYSKLLGFKIIVNFNDIFLKSYHDFLVEFMACLYVRTFFPILYMYMCVCFIKKKKKNLMTFFVMSYVSYSTLICLSMVTTVSIKKIRKIIIETYKYIETKNRYVIHLKDWQGDEIRKSKRK